MTYAAISGLAAAILIRWRARALRRRLRQIEDRIEIDPRHPYDGIYCRDETIRLQDKEIDSLRAELARRGAE